MNKIKSLVYITLILTSFSNCFSQEKYNYKFDAEKDLIFYEEIIEFNNKSVAELKKSAIKFFAIEKKEVSYDDENEIYAMGIIEKLMIKKFLLAFRNTDVYRCVYDIKISIKENKIKFYASNFLLIPENINIKSYSLFGGPSRFGLSGAMSTSKIPTDIPKHKIEKHYPDKLNDKHLLFPMLNNEITKTISNLKNILTDEEEKW